MYPARLAQEGAAAPNSPYLTETTISSPTLHTVACLAAGILLSAAVAPAHAQQVAPARSAASGQAARPAPWECRRLRAAILDGEQSDRRVRAAMMESVQQDLAILRERYRKLNCRAALRRQAQASS